MAIGCAIHAEAPSVLTADKMLAGVTYARPGFRARAGSVGQ